MAKNMQSPGTCLCLHQYTDLGISKRPLTIAALKTILRPWNKSMKIVLKGLTAFFDPMSERLWRGIWIAGIFSTVLPGSSAETVAMNTYWPFPVNAVTFARLVTKRG